MSPSRPFILRPVATSLLMAGLLLVASWPTGSCPFRRCRKWTIRPFRWSRFIRRQPGCDGVLGDAPLERQFGQVPGLNQMTSTSSSGASVITLQFTLDLNIDVAEQQVQAAINAAETFLPTDLPNPPIYSKTNPADTPILTLALTSDSLPLVEAGGFCRHASGAEDFAVAGRRPGEHQRRAEAGRAHSGQSDGAFLLRH